MDNDSKLSEEQIKRLISDFKNAKSNDTVNAEEFARTYLSPKQVDSLKKVMNNPELMKKILSSEKTKDILRKLKGDNFNES